MESSDSNDSKSEVISDYDSEADQDDNFQDTQILRAGESATCQGIVKVTF